MPKIHDIIKNTIQSEFYQDIFKLFSGMFVARLVPAIFGLAIARLYAPAQFGDFILYLSIGSLLSIIATGKYESAILIAENEEQKAHLFRLSTKLSIIINIFSFLILIAWTSFIQPSVHPTQKLMLLLTPVYAFFFGNIRLIHNLFISHKKFKKISSLEIFRSIIAGSLQCAFFLMPETGLFWGVLIAQVITYMAYARKVKESKSFSLKLLSEEEKRAGKRFINFPKFSVLSEGFNFLSSQLPVFLIKPFFGGTILGLYSFPHRYVSTPIQLTSKATSNVYIEKAQSLKDKPKELSSLTLSLFKRQFILGIIPFTILGLWGKELFVFLLGADWEFSGVLAQLISPWLFAVYLGSPLSSILIVREKQHISMYFNIFLFIARAGALLAGGILFKDIYITIVLFSLVGFLFFAFLLFYSFHLSHVSLTKTLLFMLKIIAFTFVPLFLINLWL